MSATPPAGLDATGRAAWKRAAAALEAQGEALERSGEPLAAYARAMSVLGTLQRDWEAAGRPTTAEGHTGQPVAHPLVGAIEKAERWAHLVGESLGLDPASRRRMARALGRPAGSASAPDRAAPARRRLRGVA